MKSGIRPTLFGIIRVTFVLCFFIASKAIAQQNSSADRNFDSIYFETAVNLSAQDIDQAILVSDSLYRNSEKEIHRLKALMLSSTLFQQKSEMKKSIQFAEKADEIAVRNKFYDWEARIAGFLSTNYRQIGLYDQGEKYLEKGKKVSKLIENDQIKTLYLGMIYQETAYYALADNNYQKAYKSVERAADYFEKISDEVNKNYFLATNEELFGRSCLGLKRWNEALEHYNKALSRLSKVTQEDAMLDGFIQSGLGRAYLEKKENPSALPHLLKAEKIALHSNHLELKIEVFKTLSHYYKSEGEYDKFSDYHDKYIESFELSEKKKKQTIDSFVHTIQEEEKRLTGKQNILIIVSVSLTLFVIILFIWHRRSKKRTIERFNAVMRNMKVQTSETLSPKPETSSEITQTKDKKPLISAAVETKILAGLLEFEKTEKFTDKQISLPILAGILNTNTKYLSYILRTHKNKDFNTYINELRVKYIIEKLEKYETFQNYKISYLAEEAGFSSHSKFSAVFKSVTGFPPSTFLNLLKTRS